MSSLPSTRAVLERAAAAAAHRSADILLVLAELEQDAGWAESTPGLCTEHQAAANRLAELHLLIDHLAANLRGGHGVPPTPPAPAPRQGMRPVTHTQARPVDSARAPAAAVAAVVATAKPRNARRDDAQGNRPDGLITRDEAISLVGYSAPGFALARRAGRIPEPHAYQGKSPLWQREQLAGIKRLRASTRTRA